MEEATTEYKVLSGFESAHEEWLKIGGETIRQKYLHGSKPAFYRTTYWKLVREAVFKRDSFQCRRCGEKAEQVHHLSYGHRGRDHLYPESLISVCYVCHGLVEYARIAESLAATLRYRLACVDNYLAGKPAHIPETPLKSLSRLLEYQFRLDGMRDGYHNRHLIGEAKPQEGSKDFEGDAQKTLQSWNGTDKEKSQRIKTMLLSEMKGCADFIGEVLGLAKASVSQ